VADSLFPLLALQVAAASAPVFGSDRGVGSSGIKVRTISVPMFDYRGILCDSLGSGLVDD
jgi:hypothetical protein